MRVTARADAGACCTRETDEGKRARAGSRHAQRTCRETSRARAGEQHVRLRAHTRCAESPASAARSTAAPSPACSPSHRAAGCALGAPGTLTSSRSPGDHPPPPQPRACASRVDIPHGAVDGRGRDPAEAPTAGPCSKFKVFVVRISFDLQAWCQQQPVRTAGGWEGKVVRGARAWRRLACWRESARVGVGGGRPRSGVRRRRRAALRCAPSASVAAAVWWSESGGVAWETRGPRVCCARAWAGFDAQSLMPPSPRVPLLPHRSLAPWCTATARHLTRCVATARADCPEQLSAGARQSECPFVWQAAVAATPLQAALALVKSDASLETMNKLVRNCAQNPGEEKYRKVRVKPHWGPLGRSVVPQHVLCDAAGGWCRRAFVCTSIFSVAV